MSRIWLVLSDPFPTRVFFDCGIVDGLRQRFGQRLEAIVLPQDRVADWAGRLGGTRVTYGPELFPWHVKPVEKAVRRTDAWLDRLAGFYPLAVRHSLQHGFHRDRWRPGHRNWFLDPTRSGPLPRVESLDRVMTRWHYSPRRYVSSTLVARMRRECGGLVLSNLQAKGSVPFLLAARRLRLPVVGYVASWDHTVGKGIVSPHVQRYVVQNETMLEDLRRYHGIEPERIAVTGWPQTDVFSARRPRERYEALVTGLGLDAARPVVLYAGNTPTNAPYEGNLVRRLVDWWRANGARAQFSLLFRPHPRDDDVAARYAAAAGQDGAAVQQPSYADIEDLATLLQHVDCVVANAGTILLEALVNDRPAVCVTFDEGAPPGERWAELNLGGEHYRQLAQSAAFYRAASYDELVEGIRRALAAPEELAVERQHAARAVVGEVDGQAANRVVEAVAEALDRRIER